jgi:hypothetical protein
MTYKIEIEISDLEAKAWHTAIGDAQEWVEALVRGEVYRVMHNIYDLEVARLTEDPNVETIPASVETVVANADLTSAKERDQASIEKITSEILARTADPE